jgi:hypothetical protein
MPFPVQDDIVFEDDRRSDGFRRLLDESPDGAEMAQLTGTRSPDPAPTIRAELTV